MAEGTSLLRMHTAYTCIVGSNPTVSASFLSKVILDCQETRSLYSEPAGFLYSTVQFCAAPSSRFRGIFWGMRAAPKTTCPQNHA